MTAVFVVLQYIKKYPQLIIKTCVLCVFSLLLLSCESTDDGIKDVVDKDIQLTRKEFKDALVAPKSLKKLEQQPPLQLEPPIPEISDILTAPKPPAIGNEKLVTISVTEEIPLKDVLIELGRLADIDMEIDSGISGGIILSVKNKPFNEVVERIAAMQGLRYEEKKGVLRIERDLPYLVTYEVDFINLIRSNTGSVTTNTQVLSATVGDGAGGGDSLSSGSTNSISSSYDGDLWTSIEETITNILTFLPQNISSAGGDDEEAGTEQESDPSFTMNRQAGIISILGTQRQHENVKSYLDKVKKTVSSQVLIEAKIVEVALNEEFRTGIDWSTLGGDIDAQASFSAIGTPTNFAADDLITLTATSVNNSLDYVLNAVDFFGTSRTLSSPRLHAMNNQQAVLTFAENEVYFTLEVEEEEEDAAAGTQQTLTIESTLNTVPIGVLLSIQPAIDVDNEEITLNIRPTLSRITRRVNDPAVDIIVQRNLDAGADETSAITSEIPVIEVRELDSVMKVRSGQVMILGGLMEERTFNEDTGVPFVSAIPVLGNAFKSIRKESEVVETVIFIKATIIPSEGVVTKADKDFYKTFTRDRRPLAF